MINLPFFLTGRHCSGYQSEVIKKLLYHNLLLMRARMLKLILRLGFHGNYVQRLGFKQI